MTLDLIRYDLEQLCHYDADPELIEDAVHLAGIGRVHEAMEILNDVVASKEYEDVRNLLWKIEGAIE